VISEWVVFQPFGGRAIFGQFHFHRVELNSHVSQILEDLDQDRHKLSQLDVLLATDQFDEFFHKKDLDMFSCEHHQNVLYGFQTLVDCEELIFEKMGCWLVARVDSLDRGNDVLSR
jgi:hypothetical protein